MTRKQILDAAEKCVNGGRDEQYGSPEDSFSGIAHLWEWYISERCVDGTGTVDITGADISAMMALMKIVRIAHSPEHQDSWIDLAGYAACGGEIATGDGHA